MGKRVWCFILHTVPVACAILLAHVAYAEKPALLLGCEAKPDTVHAGEPVTINGAAVYGDTKRPADYTWQSTGGRVSGAGDHATVNTSGLAPRDYTVTGHASQGAKPNQQASCTTRFKVIPFEPPSVTCRSTPAEGPAGTTFDINALGISPYNRPLTYAFASTAGRVTPAGNSAKLITKDIPPGTLKVTCYVVDDRGLSASATTQINLVSQLAQQPSNGMRRLCSLSFARDREHPVRVDGPDENCLDSVAGTLRQNPTARLVIVGNASPDEAVENAAERSLNARQYLVVRGIDRARIEVRVGETSGPTANITLVPHGLAFNEPNTSTFDESQIVLHGTPYVPLRAPANRPGRQY